MERIKAVLNATLHCIAMSKSTWNINNACKR